MNVPSPRRPLWPLPPVHRPVPGRPRAGGRLPAGRAGAALCILGACLVLAPAPARAGGQPVAESLSPLAPLPTAVPWDTHYGSRQHRVREAESKARAGLRWSRAVAGRDRLAAKAMDGYDVRHYHLALDLNTTTRVITATNTIEAVVTGAPLTQLALDFGSQMTATAARVGGAPATFAWDLGVLTVNLDRAYAPGEKVVVAVDYSGNPSSSYFGWSTYGGQPLIWTLSEPYGAPVWWPCKDVNTDKADSVALDVTVPSTLTVVSNGTLAGVDTPVAGRKTYRWRERHPICPYLVSLAIHPYATFNQVYHPAGGGTMPVTHWVVPAELGNATAGFAPTVDMITAFAAAFGEYPFVDEKYGHAQFPWGGGMEHQTCTSLYYGTYAEYIIAHELGHQWFGDLVTCADFSHVWLQEGFATWLEAYWKEVRYGAASYQAEMAAARYLGPGTIIVEDPTDFSAIFDYSLSYQKASWVPHMLRHVVGDAAFFAGLQLYRSRHGYGSATTEQFRAAMEDASGLDLGAFFQQWIYGQYYPRYDWAWTAEPAGAGWRVRLRVEQSQTNTGLFTMPLDVQVGTDSGPLTFTVQNSQAEQWYAFDVPSMPTGVALDPDNWVLCEKRFQATSAVPAAPVAAKLLGAAPNPFNPRTEVRFRLAADGPARLDVHDAAGRLVAVLADGAFAAGDHAAAWDGRDRAGRAAASGTYFARLTAGGRVDTAPLTLVR